MCGFVALYNIDGAPIDRDVLARMTDAQRHRGPDDQAFADFSVAGGKGAFGFNRLSIRDLSPKGRQPMTTTDGRVMAVYNGELYNADEQREHLVRRGHTFRGTSDTEVLLEMYRAYGIEETLARSNGMFALCLVDLAKERILLVRDRLGIKPLYFWQTPRTIAAASEVKSFLYHPDFSARLDEGHLAEHLAFRSCAGDRHLLRGVKQVEPGEWIDITRGELRRKRWWRPPVHTTWTRGFDAAVDAVDDAIDRAVGLQLVSDVPVGCQFSGGLDSSVVSAYANKRTKRGNYQSFSIIVDDPRFDETRWIDEAGKHLGVPGHRYQFGEREFAERLDRASWHLDQPLDHMNSIGIMRLAEGSREHVTVLLSGEGADEAFGGYSRFLRVLYRPALAVLAPLGARFSAFDRSRGKDSRDWFIRASSPILPAQLGALLGRDAYDDALDVRRAMFPNEGSFLSRCRAYELETFLVGLLKRQDKMTMASSLENRVPLLDHELVELVSSMPASYCVTRRPSRHPLERNTKRLLKTVAVRHFPKPFVYRKKEGFGMPIGTYLRSPSMQPLVEDLIASTSRRGLFDAGVMRSWWTSGQDEALWIAVAFELWARRFLDGVRSSRVDAAERSSASYHAS
jgi:asparagine synthase (glutamine-hydrolysing)